MAEKRVKLTQEEDKISKLPDAIITHILSFLPTSKDLVPTMLLSKRWKLIWYSVLTLSFSDLTLSDTKKFCNFVDNFLKHHKRGMSLMSYSLITSFKLKMYWYDTSQDDHIDKWLAFAVENKFKEISINFTNGWYCLPQTVLVNTVYLTMLKLSKVRLDSHYSFSFPSLKSLSLESVHLPDNDVVDKLLLGSPSLENLQLHCCALSTNRELNIRSLSLKFLEIHQPKVMVGKIEAVNLESLVLEDVYFDKVNFSVCKAIKNLTLNFDWRMSESSLVEYVISNLPLLENLALEYSHKVGLEHIKISNQHLKTFKLIWLSQDEIIVVIESAPKLESFWYNGYINISISMVESSNLLNGTFIILDEPENYDENWFLSLMNFFSNLNCPWNMISLHVDSPEVLIFPEYMKRVCHSPLVNWENIRVLIQCNRERELELKDSLLWISPSLKTFYLTEWNIYEF
ncbi:hypothetical protein CsatB_018515 [Cannabis sativa]